MPVRELGLALALGKRNEIRNFIGCREINNCVRNLTQIDSVSPEPMPTLTCEQALLWVRDWLRPCLCVWEYGGFVHRWAYIQMLEGLYLECVSNMVDLCTGEAYIQGGSGAYCQRFSGLLY